MLTDSDFAMLCDIGQSIAFSDSDDRHDGLFRLIADGYVQKDGDTYELTAKGRRQLTSETGDWWRYADAVGKVLVSTRKPAAVMP